MLSSRMAFVLIILQFVFVIQCSVFGSVFGSISIGNFPDPLAVLCSTFVSILAYPEFDTSRVSKPHTNLTILVLRP